MHPEMSIELTRRRVTEQLGRARRDRADRNRADRTGDGRTVAGGHRSLRLRVGTTLLRWGGRLAPSQAPVGTVTAPAGRRAVAPAGRRPVRPVTMGR